MTIVLKYATSIKFNVLVLYSKTKTIICYEKNWTTFLHVNFQTHRKINNLFLLQKQNFYRHEFVIKTLRIQS